MRSAGGHSQFRLLAERRFGLYFGVQLLGAFNGHLFRQGLAVALACDLHYARMQAYGA